MVDVFFFFFGGGEAGDMSKHLTHTHTHINMGWVVRFSGERGRGKEGPHPKIFFENGCI